ncbi:MAG: hypothetical protein ABSG74_14075 [Candidatus Bathyarchaeia archaeon]|jgi:hypothetical protein
MASITAVILEIIVGAIILAPVLWLVGRAIVGKTASLMHAIWIVVLGVIINAILGTFVHGLLGLLVTLVLWLVLIKQFFATSWGKAALVAIVAVVVLAIIAVILAFLGIGALAGLLGV